MNIQFLQSFKSLLISLLFILLFSNMGLSQRGNGNERRIGIGIEYASATSAIMPNFIVSTNGVRLFKSKTYLSSFFKISAGPESGYYNGDVYSSQIENSLKQITSGTQLLSYDFNDLNSGIAVSFSAIPTFIIPTKSSKEGNRISIEKWFYFGIGVKLTSHTKTEGNYTVISRDSQYEYTGLRDYEFHPRFIDISPTFILYGRKFGISYSPQSVFDKSTRNGTLGINYLFQF